MQLQKFYVNIWHQQINLYIVWNIYYEFSQIEGHV